MLRLNPKWNGSLLFNFRQGTSHKKKMAFLSTTGRVRVRSRRLLLHLRDRSRSLHLHPATDRGAYFLSSRVRSRWLLFTPPRPIAQTTFPTRQSELQDSVEADLNKSKGQLVHLCRGGGRAQTLASGQHST